MVSLSSSLLTSRILCTTQPPSARSCSYMSFSGRADRQGCFFRSPHMCQSEFSLFVFDASTLHRLSKPHCASASRVSRTRCILQLHQTSDITRINQISAPSTLTNSKSAGTKCRLLCLVAASLDAHYFNHKTLLGFVTSPAAAVSLDR